MSGTDPVGTRAPGGLEADHPAAPRRLPVAGQPAVELARAARPGREGRPRDRGRRHAGDPAGLGLALRPPPRPVRRHRRAGRRASSSGAPTRSARRPSAAAAPSRSPCGRCPRGCSPRTSSTASSRAPSCGSRCPRATSCCPTRRRTKMLFLVGGSGVTPVMAMLRTLDRRGTMPDVVMHYSSPTAERMIFRDELARARGQARRRCTLHRLHTDTDGMLDLADLDDDLPRLARARDLGLRPGADARRDRRALGGRPASRTSCTSSGSRSSSAATAARAAPSPSGTPARPSRSTAPPPCSRPARRPASGCPTAAGWASATPARSPWSRARSATCATATSSTQPNEQVQTCVTAAVGDCTFDI